MVAVKKLRASASCPPPAKISGRLLRGPPTPPARIGACGSLPGRDGRGRGGASAPRPYQRRWPPGGRGARSLQEAVRGGPASTTSLRCPRCAASATSPPCVPAVSALLPLHDTGDAGDWGALRR